MREEVSDRDSVLRKRRQKACRSIVEREPATLGESKDRRRGELLGQRSEAIVRVGRAGQAFFEIGHPVTLAKDDLTLTHDEHGRAGNVAAVVAHQPVDGLPRHRASAGYQQQ